MKIAAILLRLFIVAVVLTARALLVLATLPLAVIYALSNPEPLPIGEPIL